VSVEAIEGYVENGQVRLPPNTRLPEHAKVYVVVPEAATGNGSTFADVSKPRKIVHLRSPRLADPKHLEFFRKTFVKDQQ